MLGSAGPLSSVVPHRWGGFVFCRILTFLLFFICLCVYLFVCVCVCMSAGVCERPEGSDPRGARSRCCNPPNVGSGSNSSPLEEQYMLLTAKPTLQHPIFIF